MKEINLEKQMQKVRKYIQDHKLAVLATVNHSCLPEAAVIGFSMNDRFELFFGTSVNTRKYENILGNPRVAAVIGWEKGKTVQYEGEAYQLSEEEKETYAKTNLGEVPSITKYIHEKDAVFYKVDPKYIRYADVSTSPWEVFEFREFS